MPRAHPSGQRTAQIVRDYLDRLRRRVAAATQRPMLREFLRFGGSTFAIQASRVGAGLVVAGMLGPTLWGTWYLLNLIVVYGALTHLGVLNGLNREVPSALGRGDPQMADAIRKNALGMTLIGTGTVSTLLIILAATTALPLSLLDAGVLVALLWGHQAFDFVSMSLKSTTRFTALANLQALSAAAYPVMAVGGAWALGLHGFIAGQVAVFAVACLMAWKVAGVDFRVRLQWPIIRSLIRIGFPIMLVGLTHTLFTTVDRWVVSATLGAEALGHYSLAIMALGAVGLLPQVVAQQYYPRIAHAWAARRDTTELRRFAHHIRINTLVVAAPVTAGTLVVLPLAVRFLLPDYTPGVPALMITVFAPLVGAVGQGYGHVLHMLDRQAWLVVAIIGATLFNATLSIVLVGPFGLAGVAFASVASFLVYALGRIAMGHRALRLEDERQATRSRPADRSST